MGRDGIEAAREAVPALLVAAGSPRRTLAASASYALGRIGCPPEHVQEAATLARAATQSMARGYLLRSIRDHADLALREALLAELSTESATFPRIEALGLARDNVGIESVMPYLEATDVSVRVAAVAALGRLDSDVSPMLAELAGDEHAWVAREAADALVSRGAALPPTPALSEAQRVASLVPSHSMESVLQMALEDSRAVVRSAACARILDPTPTEADGLRPEQLQPLLDSADPVVRACGVQALAGLQPAVSLPWLVRLAWQDEDSEVRY